nr:MAG TPA: hypothetical protein [Caudoviricetes sp.]DAO43158.1 MAG TPA: hypothetical protein [Caudoviricetes sp.]
MISNCILQNRLSLQINRSILAALLKYLLTHNHLVINHLL